MKEAESLLKNIKRYTASNIFQRACGIINTFIKPKLLSPELYGLWNLLSIVITYASNVHLGSRNALFYLLPYHLSRNETNDVNNVKSSAFYGSLYLTLIITAGLFVYSFWGNLNKIQQSGLISVGIIIILNCVFDYHYNEISGYKNFKLISYVNYKRAIVSVVLNFILIYFFGIYGIYLSTLFTVLIMVVYMYRESPIILKEPFKIDVYYALTKKGLPILIYNVSNDLISTVDKIIIAYFLGTKELGHYAITGLVFNFLMQIPGDARDVIEISLMENLTTGNREETLNKYFFQPLYYTSHIMPFIIGPAFFLIKPFIELLLPKYINGIAPTQIVTIGCYFYALAFVARGMVISNNKQFSAAIVITAVLLFNACAAVFFILKGYGTVGVAFGSSFSFFILFISLFIFVQRFNREISLLLWVKKTKDIFIIFFVMGCVVAALVFATSNLTVNKHIGALLSTVVFCLIMYAVSAYLNPGFLHFRLKKIFKLKKG
ncbi:MAG: polysaccharide biosynthesis C-terminal domain-containing protein [Nitrospirae bacterium YQR-1]